MTRNRTNLILIVEDYCLMRRMLRDFLRAAYPDTRILEAGNGASALAICRMQHPRLVLMDIGLPDVNGFDLAEQVRKLLPDVVVIMVSQHTQDAFVQRAREAGAADYISKDNVYRDLIPAVGRALGRSPPGGNHPHA